MKGFDVADMEAMMERSRIEAERTRPQRVASWRENILPIFIEQWPQAVHALSVSSLWVPFPVAPWRAGWEAEGASESEQARIAAEYYAAIEPLIDDLRGRIGGAAFFRLGSRSPKDWWYGHPSVGMNAGCTQPVTATTREIADSFASSERVLEDSFDARDADYEMQLVARAWVYGIQPHREFRCFMDNRKLAGISVYRAWEEAGQPQVAADPARWESAIREWFPRFAEASHVKSVVFDVVVLEDRVVLLELNPWRGGTYPAHFLDRELDGRFRYIGDGDSEPVS